MKEGSAKIDISEEQAYAISCHVKVVTERW